MHVTYEMIITRPDGDSVLLYLLVRQRSLNLSDRPCCGRPSHTSQSRRYLKPQQQQQQQQLHSTRRTIIIYQQLSRLTSGMRVFKRLPKRYTVKLISWSSICLLINSWDDSTTPVLSVISAQTISPYVLLMLCVLSVQRKAVFHNSSKLCLRQTVVLQSSITNHETTQNSSWTLPSASVVCEESTSRHALHQLPYITYDILIVRSQSSGFHDKQ